MVSKSFILTILSFQLLASFSFGQEVVRLDNTRISEAALDARIKLLMKNANIQGLAVAVFNKNEPVYKKSFGYKNFLSKEPLTNETNIYGASFSKAVFAVLVMQLAEKGIIDLDKPLHEFLPQPIYSYTPKTKWHDDYNDLKADTSYHKITARMCLNHTSGFPNWRWEEPDEKLRVKTKPGSRYSYSGEGPTIRKINN